MPLAEAHIIVQWTCTYCVSATKRNIQAAYEAVKQCKRTILKCAKKSSLINSCV